MAKNNTADSKDTGEKKEGNKVLTVLIVLLIVMIWLAFFAFLIKLDIGGFGSKVLNPILKDVPLLHRILPESDSIKQGEGYDFKSISEAVARIKELEQTIEDLNAEDTDSSEKMADLQAEIERLKVFEEEQKEFEERVAKFDKNVVFGEKAPDIEEYKAYYEEINPTNAEVIYKQVVEQLQYSEAILEKANMYKNMKPKAAAKVFETMSADVESVAKMLLSMKPKESGAIIAEMDPVVAAKITKKMLDMDAERLAD